MAEHVKFPQNLILNEIVELLVLTKKALELACMRLGTYDGATSAWANPEIWIDKAFLMTRTSGWELKK